MFANDIINNNEGLTFGLRLKTLRESKGYTQEQLGNKIGVRKQTISNWENENVLPSIEQVIKIADIFNCTLDYMFSRVEEYKVNTKGLDDEQINILVSIIKEFNKYNELKELDDKTILSK